MSLSIPNTFSAGTVVDASDVNENFTAVASKFSNIDNSDIKSGAGISIDKLSASYEYTYVKLSGASTTAAVTTTPIDFWPIHNDGKGVWTVVSCQYLLIDGGSTNPAIRPQFGYYTDNSTTWNLTTAITAATTLTVTDNTNKGGTITVTGTSIDPGATGAGSLGIGLFTTTAGVASGVVYVSILLKRQIAT